MIFFIECKIIVRAIIVIVHMTISGRGLSIIVITAILAVVITMIVSIGMIISRIKSKLSDRIIVSVIQPKLFMAYTTI